jgi:hypothetical protein
MVQSSRVRRSASVRPSPSMVNMYISPSGGDGREAAAGAGGRSRQDAGQALADLPAAPSSTSVPSAKSRVMSAIAYLERRAHQALERQAQHGLFDRRGAARSHLFRGHAGRLEDDLDLRRRRRRGRRRSGRLRAASRPATPEQHCGDRQPTGAGAGDQATAGRRSSIGAGRTMAACAAALREATADADHHPRAPARSGTGHAGRGRRRRARPAPGAALESGPGRRRTTHRLALALVRARSARVADRDGFSAGRRRTAMRASTSFAEAQ